MPDVVQCSCGCLGDLKCHFCQGHLNPGEFLDDFEAWADYVIVHDNHVAGDEIAATYTPPPPTYTHVLAHAECGEGRKGVERG